MKCENVERILLSVRTWIGLPKNLGQQITKDYQGKKLLMVGILKGCFMFMADLMRYVELPCQMDFMICSSYGAGTDPAAKLK